jgi:hypothetical protein
VAAPLSRVATAVADVRIFTRAKSRTCLNKPFGGSAAGAFPAARDKASLDSAFAA